jgi:hypothetical protein
MEISEQDSKDIMAMRRYRFLGRKRGKSWTLGVVWRGPLHCLTRMQGGRDYAYGITVGPYLIGITRHRSKASDN